MAPSVESLGYEFWGLQYQGGANARVLRVYIDSPTGISVEDCATVSRQLSALLDVEDPINGEYRLEVSSPGMDRPFFTLEQYARYVGHRVKVKLRWPFDGRRQFTGVLADVNDGELVLRDTEHEYCLPFESVDKGQLLTQ